MTDTEDLDLQKRDWQFILDTLYRINSISDFETFQYEVLSCLRSLIPNKQGTFFALEMDKGIAWSKRPAVVGEPIHHLEEFMSGAYDDDPYFNGLYLKTTSHAFRDTDMIPEDIRKSARIYREIYEDEDSIYILRLLFAHENKSIGEVSLFRSAAQGDFSKKEVFIADLLAPHIALKLVDVAERESRSKNTPEKQSLLEKYDLSSRELQVIQMVLDGMSEREIADDLCISLSTVKKHVYNAYHKLGVNNRIQLVNLIG